MPPALRLSGAILVVAATVLAACGGGGEVAPSATTEAPATTTTVATTSTVPPTTTTTVPPPPPPPPTAEEVGAVQDRLGDLGYFLSDPRGVDGPGTRDAVMAFQKLHGLARDGVAGPLTLAALAAAGPVTPAAGPGPHIEVHLATQVVVVVAPDGRATAVNATTGASATPTPPGSYRVFRQVDGWDPGPYGPLYRPKYFVGGIALHGGVPVLAEPASHGCVRLPDPAVDWLWAWGLADPGTPVVVL